MLKKHLVIIIYLLNRYDVLSIADEEKLIAPITDSSKPVKYFVKADGKDCRDKWITILSDNTPYYANQVELA